MEAEVNSEMAYCTHGATSFPGLSLLAFASPLSSTPVKEKRDPQQKVIEWELVKE